MKAFECEQQGEGSNGRSKGNCQKDESQVVEDNSAAQANSNSQNIPEAEPAQ